LAKSDLYEIEAFASQDSLALIRAANSFKLAKLALIQEMNLNENDIELTSQLAVKPLKAINTYQTQSIFQASLSSLPQLQISKLNVASTKKQFQISKTALLPSIHLGGGISTGYSDNFKDINGSTIPFRDQIQINENKYVGISLNYPIFGNGRTRSQIRIAKKELEIAENQYSIEKQKVLKTIQELVQKLEATKSEINVNKANLKAKHKVYEIAQKKYNKELISLYELQMASSEHLSAKIEQIRLNLQLKIQQRTLDFYNGTFTLPLVTSLN
jgi:outer membrane protein TolC